MAETTKSSFVTEDGRLTPASFLILLGLPLLLSGRIFIGIFVLSVAFIFAIRTAMSNIKEEDKQEIRCNILEPEDLVAELQVLVETCKEGQDHHDKAKDRGRSQCLATLSALAKKYGKKKKKKINNSNNENEKGRENLSLLCQEAAYITLELFPNDDDILTGAVALLALVAKDPQVRQRNKYQADTYGLDKPIQCLRRSLERAKKEENEDKEEQLAEIQRKGCLFLGALSDGDKDLDIGIKIVEEDGLQLILDTANWFRYHAGVANWALWAIFILCYDQLRNKVQLVRLGGVMTICELLHNNPTSLEVNRHGVAVLFDLLREGQATDSVKFDPWEVRKLALSAGLHKVVLRAMTEFSDSMDIMMMGQEMLVGTGYRGDIPQYQQI